MMPVVVKHSRAIEVDAVDVLGGLRRALAELIGSLPSRPRKASDLADDLGIDRNLGWKVWRASQSRESIPSPKHLPGRSGVDIFLAAAAKAGAPDTLISDVRTGYERFEQFSSIHGGDRASTEIVLSGMTNEGRRRLEMTLRRAAFRANSHFLGTQARTLYRMDIVLPPVPGFMPDTATIRGIFGLWRTRANKPLVIAHSGLIQQRTMKVTSQYQRSPLDSSLGPTDYPFLHDFCSSPLPHINRQVTADGATIEDELATGPVGRSAAVDIVTAELLRRMPIDTARRGALMTIRTPAERMCFDLLLHKSAWDGVVPRVRAHTTVHGEYTAARDDLRDEIPLLETIECLGSADRLMPVPEVPRQADITRRAFALLHADPSEFTGFRIRLKFPPLPVCIAMDYSVPQSVLEHRDQSSSGSNSGLNI